MPGLADIISAPQGPPAGPPGPQQTASDSAMLPPGGIAEMIMQILAAIPPEQLAAIMQSSVAALQQTAPGVPPPAIGAGPAAAGPMNGLGAILAGAR